MFRAFNAAMIALGSSRVVCGSLGESLVGSLGMLTVVRAPAFAFPLARRNFAKVARVFSAFLIRANTSIAF